MTYWLDGRAIAFWPQSPMARPGPFDRIGLVFSRGVEVRDVAVRLQAP
jgi:hypothetical protein